MLPPAHEEREHKTVYSVEQLNAAVSQFGEVTMQYDCVGWQTTATQGTVRFLEYFESIGSPWPVTVHKGHVSAPVSSWRARIRD